MDEINDYASYLATEKKASENTMCSYLRDVRQFAEYCGREGLDLIRATRTDVGGYIRYLTGCGKSVSTVTRAAASLKSFYGYLVRLGKVAVNPARGVAPEALPKEG